jgi:membrane-associated protease RseP (regulator of RpoE activity)
MFFVYIIVAILALMFMITIHELGHYLAAKALGFRVNEFAIGFGKAIFKRKNKKTGEIFSIRVLPLGGYCAFAGEDDAGSPGASKKDYTDHTDEKYIPYDKQRPWKRFRDLAHTVCQIKLVAFHFSAKSIIENPFCAAATLLFHSHPCRILVNFAFSQKLHSFS